MHTAYHHSSVALPTIAYDRCAHFQVQAVVSTLSESCMLWLQYDPDLLNSFDSNPKRHLNYAARYSRSESLVDEEDAMLSHEAQPWNADLEGEF